MIKNYRSYLFDGLYFQRYLCGVLYRYLGPSSYSNDYSYLLTLIADQALATTTDFHKREIYHEFMRYGILEEVAEDILLNLYYDLKRCFKIALGVKLGMHNFNVSFKGYTIYIEDYGPAKGTIDEDDSWAFVPRQRRKLNAREAI